MRGGTSRAVFLAADQLPDDSGASERMILQVFGSPDRRQIYGLGGADPLTSKLAVISPPGDYADRADLIYTFGQVGIDEPHVDWHSLCGNITAAVGIYAIEEGFTSPAEPLTRVRVYNTNLRRMLYVEVPVENGRPVEEGDYIVPGVPGSGARILIDFADTAGGATGSLLPTGRPVDEIAVEGVGEIEMSLVDIGNAHVFVRASDVGMTGTETGREIDSNPDLLKRLEAIRGAAAARMGMISAPSASRRESPATPILGVISAPAAYRDEIGGRTIGADEVDVVSRLQFMQQTHKTYAGTSTVCTGAASRIPGTIVHQNARLTNRRTLRIGHPAGVIETETVLTSENGALGVQRATLGRTARRILEGTVYLPDPGRPDGTKT